MVKLKMYTPEALKHIFEVVQSDDSVTYESLAEMLGTTPTAVKTSLARRGLSLKRIRELETDSISTSETLPDWVEAILKHPYVRKHAARYDMTAKGFIEAIIETVIYDDLASAVLNSEGKNK